MSALDDRVERDDEPGWSEDDWSLYDRELEAADRANDAALRDHDHLADPIDWSDS